MCEDILEETIQSLWDTVQGLWGNRIKNGEAILNRAFEMLVFAEVYGNSKLCSCACERISTMPMVYFMKHECFKNISHNAKQRILINRLRRCDKGDVLTDQI